MSAPRTVLVSCDGACRGNPGPGGYGVVLRDGARVRELSGGFRLTTNNRMEVLAAIVALEALPEPCTVALRSDSTYLVNAMRKGWAVRWRASGWMQAGGTRALNTDLWARLLALCERHEVTFTWVRGHVGDPDNERCDALAVAAARGTDLPADAAYEGVASRRPAQPPLFDTAVAGMMASWSTVSTMSTVSTVSTVSARRARSTRFHRRSVQSRGVRPAGR